jgi:hypothetical protein
MVVQQAVKFLIPVFVLAVDIIPFLFLLYNYHYIFIYKEII